MLRIGVIGYGQRVSYIADCFVKTKKVCLAAICDVRNDELKAVVAEQGYTDVHFYTDADQMLQSEALDGVLIGTRCALHTDYAITVARYGIPLFLEKPVSITDEQLDRLCEILPAMNEKTVVSFPLRLTDMVKKVKSIIDAGTLGEIAHVQAYNNVTYARNYFHKWYRKQTETGGLFLQKATHDLDYINYLLGDNRPVRICAMQSKQVFGGDEPAAKKCVDCDRQDTCPESPQNVIRVPDGNPIGEYCCYAKDVDIEDSGSCIVEYENGVHAVYSQNFIVRGQAGKRGARLIGYRATVEFDWVSAHITVYHHLDQLREDYSFGQGAAHFGGDDALVQNFIGVMQGIERSLAPLAEGILSAKMCLAARRSATEHVFVDLT